jgi:serine/threonine protein kinase
MLTPGTTIKGQRGSYTILREIAKGGMGLVHLARDSFGNRVVVKEPRLTGVYGDDLLKIEKLKVEATILRNLYHEHITRYIDSWSEGGTFYLVVEYVDGETLLDLFWDNPVNEDEAEKYILQVLDALSYMHSQNVVHRDINPKNIMLERRSCVKLIDFGTAKYFYTQMTPSAHTGTIVYTPGWAAPEQYKGIATFQSDIYSVGATLFFLLTGKPPMYCVKPNGQLMSPSDVNPSVKRLSTVVVKAMDPDPSRRYQTASDMRDDILGYVPSISAEAYVIYGSDKYPVSDEVIIGRADDCDIKILDPEKYVSKQHARIYMRGGRYWIEDLGSLNGTFVIYYDRYGRAQLKKLAPHTPWALADDDLIALCYSKDLGPYVVLKFKRSR